MIMPHGLERYEIVEQELDRVVRELHQAQIPEARRRELRAERERLELEFINLADKGLLKPPPPFTT